MPKIAHAETEGPAERGAERTTKIARAATERGADATRDSIERARSAAHAAADAGERAARDAAGETPDLGRRVVELVGEQVRHNLQAAAAFGRAANWAEVAEVQREFIGGSFARMNQLGEHTRAMMQSGMQAGMKAMAFPARH